MQPQIKQSKKKIPLKLSLVFNILFIPMLLCFACGETASKQPPRSEALGGWQAFSHELLLQYNDILFAVLFPCLLTFFLTFKEKKRRKRNRPMNGKEKERKVSFKLSTFFIWYQAASKHFFSSYGIYAGRLFPFLCFKWPFFFLLSHYVAFPLLIKKISRGKNQPCTHIKKRKSERWINHPSIHVAIYLSIHLTIYPPLLK